MKGNISANSVPKEDGTSRSNAMYQILPNKCNTEQRQREHLPGRKIDVGEWNRKPGLGTMNVSHSVRQKF